jgi:hypothetical protein
VPSLGEPEAGHVRTVHDPQIQGKALKTLVLA